MHAVGLAGTVAHDVIPHLAPRRFHCLINLTCWNCKAFRDYLKVIDEGLHLGLHLLAVGKNDSGSVSLYWTFRHSIEGLPDDRDGFAQFLHAAHVARVNVSILRDRYPELKLLVARVR